MAFKTITIPGKKTDTYTVTIDGKEYKCVIQDPTFDNIAIAMSILMGMGSTINIAGSGKVIFENCCIEYDQEIEDDTKVLVSLCMQFATEYVMPAQTEIKKN